MPDTAAVVDTPASTESTGPSYVQTLLGTAGEFGGDEAQPSPEVAPHPAADAVVDDSFKAAETQQTPAETATLEELIQQYAKETGLNADDPNQRKTLKRLADKELFIRQLQAAKNGQPQPQEGTAPPANDVLLTDFEKSLMEQAAPAAPSNGQPPQTAAAPVVTPAAPPAQKPAEPLLYNDIGDAWKTPEDSLSALNEAWSSNDLKKVDEIENARFRRAFDSHVAPSLLGFIEQMVEKRLQTFAEKDLGDIVPEVRRDVQTRRLNENREFAIDQLRKAGASDIENLFTEEEGPPISFDGREFKNTPLNRILVRFPAIMQIQEHHSDPVTAERKTFIARYKMAYQLYQQGLNGGVPADTARKLVEAGAGIAAKQSADRARQAINAGPGASGRGETAAKESYVKSLNNLPGEVPFSSLIS